MFPSPKVIDPVVELYNEDLPFHQLVENADEHMLLDREAARVLIGLMNWIRKALETWEPLGALGSPGDYMRACELSSFICVLFGLIYG